MNGVAYGLIGAAKVACNRGGGLALGTGEEYLTTTDRTGGRGPEPGLQGSPLVRRERAHKSGCLHTQEGFDHRIGHFRPLRMATRVVECHIYLRLGRFGLAKRQLGWPTP